MTTTMLGWTSCLVSILIGIKHLPRSLNNLVALVKVEFLSTTPSLNQPLMKNVFGHIACNNNVIRTCYMPECWPSVRVLMTGVMALW